MNEFDYLAKAKDKMNNENFIEAKSLCEKALKINSELPDAYNLRGNANYQLGYYKESIEDFSKAIEREPNNADYYYDRSWSYCNMDKYEDSIVSELAMEGKSVKKDISMDGIFYVVASARIYWDLEKKKGFLDIVFGPRFGRGFSYDICVDGGNVSLEKEKVEWVS